MELLVVFGAVKIIKNTGLCHPSKLDYCLELLVVS
jgi:hypothetical protein